MSPRSKEQFDRLREASKQKIMAAALRLFGAYGYESTSMSKVAKEAEISKGLIYNYFESKESLLKALIDDFNKQEADLMSELSDDNASVMLENIIRKFFAELRDNYEKYRLMSSLGLQINKFSFVHELCMQKTNAFFSLFEGLMSSVGIENPALEAKLFAATLDGIGFQYIMLDQEYPTHELEESLISKYVKK